MSPIRKRKSPKIERGLFVSAGHTHSSKTIFKSCWCFMGKRENEKRAIVIFPKKNSEEETGAPTITTTVVVVGIIMMRIITC